MSEEPQKQRTDQQNRALHLYLTQIAKAMDDAGISFYHFISVKDGIEIPCTMENMKEVWKFAQFHALKKSSTTKLSTKDIDKVYDIFNRYTSEHFGISIPFPDMATLLQEKDALNQ